VTIARARRKLAQIQTKSGVVNQCKEIPIEEGGFAWFKVICDELGAFRRDV
jgi:hypothetical protein